MYLSITIHPPQSLVLIHKTKYSRYEWETISNECVYPIKLLQSSRIVVPEYAKIHVDCKHQ